MIRKFFYEVIKSIFGPTVVPDTIYVSYNNIVHIMFHIIWKTIWAISLRNIITENIRF